MTWVKFIKMLIKRSQTQKKIYYDSKYKFKKIYNSVSKIHIYKEKIQVTMVVIFVERNECD